ncbi:hypothetical protein DV096_10555 [Bradymonadaceae bacterium TMQ3]|uniref:DUF4382 domain-containing protein n=1 Tax=Lujinxingia sediminis TaxID=2480984 RepID=A0ABY0CRX0_9DELT|nr:hypothetical protein [Lujinxingia sediminis]RDV38244.1 hypothetical protein DV096_10555 [Bradymonadaceae bacterium TMQ3]RVU43557.1 hypothetical protein EA187_12070 [Lujinxingia sediminis]TXC75914.1 hypothetical protein FRC91_10460 [Bradymonadales bacterium TMQ1]
MPTRLPHALLIATLTLSASALLGACGDDPAEVAPQARCAEDDLSAYVRATIEGAESTTQIDLPRATIEGAISSDGILVNLGARPLPDGSGQADLILNLADSRSNENLIDALSDRTQEAPVILRVVDATEAVTGSEGRTDVERFECTVDQDTICVQLGYDVNENETLDDDDRFVYHGEGGTVTIESFDNRTTTMRANFELTLGQNMLGFQDTSSGSLAGCLKPRYSLGSGGRYPLE